MSFLNNTFGHAVNTLSQQVKTIGEQGLIATELQCGRHHLIVKQRLAEGGFGFVDLVTDTSSQRDFVLKRCNVDRTESFETVKKEISMLQRFAGPFIVQLIDHDVARLKNNKREAQLLLALCPGGHLLDRLNQRDGKPLPAESIYRIFAQILQGVMPFHAVGITHRDLKLENVLFGEDGIVRLCDFGSCVEGPVPLRNVDERNIAQDIISRETTEMYRAPEMVDLYMRDVLTEKTDVWALGCIFYTLCFLKHPFQIGSLGALSANVTFPAVSPASPDANVIILRMLDIDPEARLSVPELLECLKAVAAGKPLPAVARQLSPEAKSRRAARLAADEVREQKQREKAKKKAALAGAPPPRPAVQMTSNSVAARRLAAKRGGAAAAPPAATPVPAAKLSGGGGASAAASEPVSPAVRRPSLEDAPQSAPAAHSLSVPFNPFAADAADPTPAGESFNPFGDNDDFDTIPGVPAAEQVDSADAFFDDEPVSSSAGGGISSFDAFQDNSGAGAVTGSAPFTAPSRGFDAFGHDAGEFFASSPSPPKFTATTATATATGSAADSLFENDLFGDVDVPSSDPFAKPSSGFDAFGDGDNFATSASAVSAAPITEFDAFASDSTSPAFDRAVIPPTGGNPFNPFGDDDEDVVAPDSFSSEPKDAPAVSDLLFDSNPFGSDDASPSELFTAPTGGFDAFGDDAGATAVFPPTGIANSRGFDAFGDDDGFASAPSAAEAEAVVAAIPVKPPRPISTARQSSDTAVPKKPPKRAPASTAASKLFSPEESSAPGGAAPEVLPQGTSFDPFGGNDATSASSNVSEFESLLFATTPSPAPIVDLTDVETSTPTSKPAAHNDLLDVFGSGEAVLVPASSSSGQNSALLLEAAAASPRRGSGCSVDDVLSLFNSDASGSAPPRSLASSGGSSSSSSSLLSLNSPMLGLGMRAPPPSPAAMPMGQGHGGMSPGLGSGGYGQPRGGMMQQQGRPVYGAGMGQGMGQQPPPQQMGAGMGGGRPGYMTAPPKPPKNFAQQAPSQQQQMQLHPFGSFNALNG